MPHSEAKFLYQIPTSARDGANRVIQYSVDYNSRLSDIYRGHLTLIQASSSWTS